MHELANHAVQRSDLQPHLIWDDPSKRDAHHAARREGRAPEHWPVEVNSHVEAVRGDDEPGAGITVHRPAPWRCPCGIDLALDYREVPAAWATHASRMTGIPPELLAAHMVVSVAGLRSTATCSCGATFQAPADDAINGDAAVAAWAAHVEALR